MKLRYHTTRKLTVKLCEPLKTEDFVVQPINDVSPPKWHLAHSTWFFEHFILKNLKGYKEFHPRYNFLFNSYYISAGERHQRPARGFMTRPPVEDILSYRKHVDEAMDKFLDVGDEKVINLLELGLNHEQQHQELLIYDLKYILGTNPLFPEYMPIVNKPILVTQEPKLLKADEGIYSIGHSGGGFHFDNEGMEHKVYLKAYGIQNKLVTNEDYAAFIEDRGYEKPLLWHMEGHEWVQENKINAPLYWHKIDGIWHRYSLRGGLRPIDPKAPVSNISMYEATAYANWLGKRLPTEFEWEVAAKKFGNASLGNFIESENFEPVSALENNNQFYGDVWEWTNSAYLPYPGYKVPPGTIGEYNGKFMINQMVLRGGSCASTANHIRATYRNFFHPDKRWVFSGIRLAENL